MGFFVKQLKIGEFKISVSGLATGIYYIQKENGTTRSALARELARHEGFPARTKVCPTRFNQVLRWVPEQSTTQMVWVVEDRLALKAAGQLLRRLTDRGFVRLAPVDGNLKVPPTKRWLWNWARCPSVSIEDGQLVFQTRPAPVPASQ